MRNTENQQRVEYVKSRADFICGMMGITLINILQEINNQSFINMH